MWLQGLRYLQGLRWLHCCLRSGLALWQTSPRTCLPRSSAKLEDKPLHLLSVVCSRWPPKPQLDHTPGPPGCLCLVRPHPLSGPVCSRFTPWPLHAPVVLPCAHTNVSCIYTCCSEPSLTMASEAILELHPSCPARGHQRADTLKPYSQKTSQSNRTRTTALSNLMKLSHARGAT